MRLQFQSLWQRQREKFFSRKRTKRRPHPLVDDDDDEGDKTSRSNSTCTDGDSTPTTSAPSLSRNTPTKQEHRRGKAVALKAGRPTLMKSPMSFASPSHARTLSRRHNQSHHQQRHQQKRSARVLSFQSNDQSTWRQVPVVEFHHHDSPYFQRNHAASQRKAQAHMQALPQAQSRQGTVPNNIPPPSSPSMASNSSPLLSSSKMTSSFFGGTKVVKKQQGKYSPNVPTDDCSMEMDDDKIIPYKSAGAQFPSPPTSGTTSTAKRQISPTSKTSMITPESSMSSLSNLNSLSSSEPPIKTVFVPFASLPPKTYQYSKSNTESWTSRATAPSSSYASQASWSTASQGHHSITFNPSAQTTNGAASASWNSQPPTNTTTLSGLASAASTFVIRPTRTKRLNVPTEERTTPSASRRQQRRRVISIQEMDGSANPPRTSPRQVPFFATHP